MEDDAPVWLSPFIRLSALQVRMRPWALPISLGCDYLMVVVVEGKEWVSVRGEQHTVQEEECYLIAPGEELTKGSEEGSTSWTLRFDLISDGLRDARPGNSMPKTRWTNIFAARCQPKPEAIWGSALPVKMPPAFGPRIAAEIPQIARLYASASQAERIQAPLKLGELLADYVARWSEQSIYERPLAERIAQAEAVVRRTLDASMDVGVFAAAAGLRPSRFHQAYKALRGKTPHAFLREARIERAKELLRDSAFDIATIAAIVGYSDATVLGRVFRRCEGVTPGEWRLRSGSRLGQG